MLNPGVDEEISTLIVLGVASADAGATTFHVGENVSPGARLACDFVAVSPTARVYPAAEDRFIVALTCAGPSLLLPLFLMSADSENVSPVATVASAPCCEMPWLPLLVNVPALLV